MLSVDLIPRIVSFGLLYVVFVTRFACDLVEEVLNFAVQIIVRFYRFPVF